MPIEGVQTGKLLGLEAQASNGQSESHPHDHVTQEDSQVKNALRTNSSSKLDYAFFNAHLQTHDPDLQEFLQAYGSNKISSSSCVSKLPLHTTWPRTNSVRCFTLSNTSFEREIKRRKIKVAFMVYHYIELPSESTRSEASTRPRNQEWTNRDKN